MRSVFQLSFMTSFFGRFVFSTYTHISRECARKYVDALITGPQRATKKNIITFLKYNAGYQYERANNSFTTMCIAKLMHFKKEKRKKK